MLLDIIKMKENECVTLDLNVRSGSFFLPYNFGGNHFDLIIFLMIHNQVSTPTGLGIWTAFS